MDTFLATFSDLSAVLNAEESWHCAKVLRKKPGEKIRLIDGHGKYCTAELTSVHEKKCEAKIIAGPFEERKRNYYLHLAVTPTKQIDRIEWMVEKVVEIGVDEISFIECKNSERKKINIGRLRNISLSAVKQSLQACVPVLNEMCKFNEFLTST